MVVTESDLLHRAADLLEEFGWRQMHIGSKAQGAFCALGATNEARRDLDAPEAVWKGARRILAGIVGGPVAHWNDTPGRTRTEVVAAIRRAAQEPAS